MKEARRSHEPATGSEPGERGGGQAVRVDVMHPAACCKCRTERDARKGRLSSSRADLRSLSSQRDVL